MVQREKEFLSFVKYLIDFKLPSVRISESISEVSPRSRIMLNSIPVYGSKSNLVIPLNFKSLSPLDLYDKKEIEYKKIELNIFKKYTIYNLYKDPWYE